MNEAAFPLPKTSGNSKSGFDRNLSVASKIILELVSEITALLVSTISTHSV